MYMIAAFLARSTEFVSQTHQLFKTALRSWRGALTSLTLSCARCCSGRSFRYPSRLVMIGALASRLSFVLQYGARR